MPLKLNLLSIFWENLLLSNNYKSVDFSLSYIVKLGRCIIREKNWMCFDVNLTFCKWKVHYWRFGYRCGLYLGRSIVRKMRIFEQDYKICLLRPFAKRYVLELLRRWLCNVYNMEHGIDLSVIKILDRNY